MKNIDENGETDIESIFDKIRDETKKFRLLALQNAVFKEVLRPSISCKIRLNYSGFIIHLYK